jgi:uncharacterized protein
MRPHIQKSKSVYYSNRRMLLIAPNVEQVFELEDGDRDEAVAFLEVRPVHTVVMTSFIHDNGIESELNRGKFYGYRNRNGEIEGIALIGHSTLVEARSEAALQALAIKARQSATPIHLIMLGGDNADAFWNYLTGGASAPRLECTEILFQASFPFVVTDADQELRTATVEELVQIAEAQAEVAFAECGVDPMARDREGFLGRVKRRIEQGRIFVVVDEAGRLVFKADIIAQTDEVAYLEGIWVSPDHRGKGIGPKCLSQLTLELLNRVDNVCLLSNVDFGSAHRSYRKAGFRAVDECKTLFC